MLIKDFADYSSIIGLIISGITFICILFINKKVAHLKQNVLFKNRIKDLLKKYKDHSSNILNYLDDFDKSKNQILIELRNCRVQLEDIIKKLPNKEKKLFRNILIRLKDSQNNQPGLIENILIKLRLRNDPTFTKEDAWSLYGDVTESINRLTNLLKDKTII